MVDGHIIKLDFFATIRAMTSETIVNISSIHNVQCIMLSFEYMSFVFPLYPTQASRQFGTFLLMMRHASATYPVPWTVLRAGAIYIVVWAHVTSV